MIGRFRARNGWRRRAAARLALVMGCLGAMGADGRSDTLESGRALYARMCAGCHGANARGGRGPDLTSGNWRWGGSDDELVRNIVKGIPGTGMPPMAMADGEARAVVAFLRSLRGSGAAAVTGDAAAGGALFREHCARCHRFRGVGGRLGPDLTGVRDEKKPAEVRDAIREPDRSLRPGFETVEWQPRGGRLVRGVRKNEDTFSL